MIRDLKEKGACICGISAPSRASTLVNYLGLDEGIIDYVCEISGSLKIGKCMPGTSIPVVEESKLCESQADCAIIFSWHIAPAQCRAARGLLGWNQEDLARRPSCS
jgi:C-methyltransferase C-terminal domain